MNMPVVGTFEWRGGSFASMDFWVDAEDQLRSQFTRADGTVAVVDPDEWDDCGDAASFGSYNSILTSPLIPLMGNPINISFDSHYRQEAPQQVYLTVTNVLGETIETLLHYSNSTGSDNAGGDVLNQRLSFIVETDESEIYFNWEMADAGNNWYWAIDNVKIQSQTPPIGDLNYDGNLNIFDLLTLAEIIVGVISPDTVLNHVSDINQDGEKFSREIKEVDKNFLEGDVLVKVDYSDLNFKDALILNNGGKLVKEFPRIPGIDFSGKVVESNADNFKEGDEVVITGCRVGEISHGGYSQFAKVKKDFLVKLPKGISTKEAMILGTAGFTSLMCAFAIKAREEILLGEKVKDVLVTGATGGVGSIAIMVLSKLGYNVTAVTGKMDKSDSLKKLGASSIIDRKEFEGEPKLLGKGVWDGVVDTVGGNILAHAISQTKHSGIVAACGNAGGIKLSTSVMPFILRGVKLWGIDSVAVSLKRREFVWSQVPNLIDFNLLNETIKVVSMKELLDIFPQMLKGQTSGRIVVDVNK